jgi:2-C-methyl-D-erythritol 4-phosphate cytidylyltransferase
MGGDLPKQFLLINGLPVLMHSINRFSEYDPDMEIVVVLPETQIPFWKDLCEKHHFIVNHLVVKGGETRFHSVNNGINAVAACDLIAIHDGVRPLVSHDTIERCFVAAAEYGSAIPVLPVNESIRKGKMNHSVAVDRSQYFQVQTPQVFNYNLLKVAYLQLWIPEFTDDASVVEKAGTSIQMVLGNRENIKITHPEDLMIAEVLLKTFNG